MDRAINPKPTVRRIPFKRDMAKPFHSRFEPKNLPDDWRDDSLYRAAVWLNQDTDIPAVFPQDSLDFLSELGYSLPRRGILFIRYTSEFINQLAINVLASSDAAVVNELRDLQRQKENAVASSDFDTAIKLRARQDELRKEFSTIAIREISRADIVDALVRDGVDPGQDVIKPDEAHRHIGEVPPSQER